MNRAYLLPAAYLLDQIAGDPEWFPHPVRLMGAAITTGERLLRTPGDDRHEAFLKGAALSVSVVAWSYLLTRGVIHLAYRQSHTLGCATEIFLAWTCLAARNLQQEAQSVSDALGKNDLSLARIRLARIVGRDTHALDSGEISRALIETLAESASDGVIAPMFYLAAGGVPLAMAYKAINTLDSMIGHRDARYLYFGKAAARFDDVANYMPSRITALCTVAAASLSQADPFDAWNTWHRDGDQHKSPNAGQPEAAMAGALRVRLGGGNYYDGELIPAPVIGARFPHPTSARAQQAIRLTIRVAMIGLVFCTLIAASTSRRRVRT